MPGFSDCLPCQVTCITNSQSLLKLMSIELVMPSNHLNLCRPLLLLPSIFPSFRVFLWKVLGFKLQHPVKLQLHLQ